MSQNIGQLLTRRAYRDPGLGAVYEPDSGRRFSYVEINARSNQVANALTETGVAKGDRVGLLLMNGCEFFETFFAVGKVGAVNVPLNWRLIPDELEFILSDAGATVLIYGEEFAENVAELRRRGDTTAITTWIQVGSAAPGGVVDYNHWMGAASADEPEAGA